MKCCKYKIILIVLLFIIIAYNFPVSANDITVEIDGVRVDFPDQQPVIIDNRTLVPVRGVFEQLGYSVNWDSSENTAILSNGDNTVIIKVGSRTFTTNGVTYRLDVPAQNINGRVMLPFRAVLESIDCKVDWDGRKNTVTVSTHIEKNKFSYIIWLIIFLAIILTAAFIFVPLTLKKKKQLNDDEKTTYLPTAPILAYKIELKETHIEQGDPEQTAYILDAHNLINTSTVTHSITLIDEVKIGREVGNDIYISDKTVSRLQCVLKAEKTGVAAANKSKINPTLINNEELGDEFRIIKSNDVFKFGNIELRIIILD